METSNTPPKAMAFYHKDGLPAAWQQAARFAGEGGHLATMPDIIAARLGTKPGETPWETYFTTLTAEYLGFSKAGNRILIIAHGVGPMATLDGVQKAYSWEYSDKDRRRNGGRITAQEFMDLEAGKFGEVTVVDFDAYCKRYKYPFSQVLRVSDAMTDPVLKARFGPQTEQYILAHGAAARLWHNEQAGLRPENRYGRENHEEFLNNRKSQHLRHANEGSNPFIIQLESAPNCCYTFGQQHGHRTIEQGYAIAHLLSTSGLCHLIHDGQESLTNDVKCHEWWNGVRLVAVKKGDSTQSGISKGPDAHQLIRNNWHDLLVPVDKKEVSGFSALIEIAGQWFTQYPKAGERMDTGEPEYVVTSAEKIGDPVMFSTTGNGSPFFKFAVNEMQSIAPPNANAYLLVGSPTPMGDMHVCDVQFYHVKTDVSKRLIRADTLAHDYDTMMNLLMREAA